MVQRGCGIRVTRDIQNMTEQVSGHPHIILKLNLALRLALLLSVGLDHGPPEVPYNVVFSVDL